MSGDVDAEIDQLRHLLGAPNDSQLAMLLSVQRSAIAQWRKRGRVPEKAKVRAVAIADSFQNGGMTATNNAAAPAGLRMMSRAIALKFVLDHGTRRDESSNGFIFRVLLMDQVEAAARDLLESSLQNGLLPDEAYRSLFDDSNLHDRIATNILHLADQHVGQ